MFEGELHYQKYSEIVDRIRKFDTYRTVGKDESGDYDLYVVELGNPVNPTIFITSSIHGNEWHTTQFTLSTLEMLRDKSYPDKELMDFLADNFHIACIPVVNPWGLDRFNGDPIDDPERRNSNGVDLNRDFGEASQVETRIVMEQLNKLQPFSYIDNHMFQSRYTLAKGNDLIVYTEKDHHHIRDAIRSDLQTYSGRDVTVWDTHKNFETLSAGWASLQTNPYTPHTLSVLSELSRPTRRPDGNIEIAFNPSELYDVGNFFLYSYLKHSIDYFIRYNKVIVTEVKTPTGSTLVLRDKEGLTLSIEEVKNDKILKSLFERDKNGNVQSVTRIKI